MFEAAPSLEAVLSRFRAAHGELPLALVELRCPGFLLARPIFLGPPDPELLSRLTGTSTLAALEEAAASRWPERCVRGLRAEVADQFGLVLGALPELGALATLLTSLEGLLCDAVERRLGELALAALRRSPDAMELSIGGGLAFMNEAWHTLTGYSREEAFGLTPGKLLRDPIAPVFDADFYSRADAMIAQGIPWISVLASRSKDGRRLWQDVTVVPTILAADGPAVNLCTRRPRDNRTDLDELLGAAYRELRSVLRAVPDGVLVLSGESILLANEALAAIVGESSAAALVSRPVLELLVPEDRPMLLERLQVGAPFAPTVLRLSGKGDRVRYCDVSSVGAVRFEGAPASILLLRDTTEHRVAQEQLIAAERLAAVGTIAAGVAHEINNPLAYAYANVELVREAMRRPGHVSEEVRLDWVGSLEDSLDGLRRIRGIVTDLRVFARRDSGGSEKSALLSRVFEAAANIVANEVRHRAQLIMPQTLALRVKGEESRLVQVFVNLLVNAAHAMPEGGQHNNVIRLEVEPQDQGRVVVRVIDTGAEIPPEIVPRLFEPFFSTKQAVGTGLGLHISRRLLRDAGGELELGPHDQRSKTFVVTLLLDAAPEAVSPPRASLPTGLQRILLIDDEPQVLAVLSRLLRGHALVTAVSGSEALEVLEKRTHFDAILCDVMMPGLTGVEVYEAIEQRWPELSPRFAFMSGGAFTPATIGFLNRFPGRVLEKPFHPDEVRALLRLLTQS